MAITTLAATNPRTTAYAAPKIKNVAGQQGPVSAKMKPSGIVNLAIGRKSW